MSELRRITEHYRLDKLVCSSASGSLFRATDLRSDDTVAVKLIAGDETGPDPAEQRDRFLQTAQTLQNLRHPAIPLVVDFGFTTGGSAFLVTEYLHGSSLEVSAGERPAKVIPLLILVASGLEAMEEQGIAHLNLGLEHVIVTSGPQGDQIKLLGLGGAALRALGGPAAGAETRRIDLRALALLACQILGITPPQGANPERLEIPDSVARELAESRGVAVASGHLAPGGEPGAASLLRGRPARPAAIARGRDRMEDRGSDGPLPGSSGSGGGGCRCAAVRGLGAAAAAICGRPAGCGKDRDPAERENHVAAGARSRR